MPGGEQRVAGLLEVEPDEAGAVTRSTPFDGVIVTGVPRAMPVVPSGGLAATTLPVGMSSLNTGSATVTPSWIACSAAVACSTVVPTSVGTVRGAGPVDTTSWTSVPGSTSPPAPSVASAGTDHEITDPGRHVLVELLDRREGDELLLGERRLGLGPGRPGRALRARGTRVPR